MVTDESRLQITFTVQRPIGGLPNRGRFFVLFCLASLPHAFLAGGHHFMTTGMFPDLTVTRAVLGFLREEMELIKLVWGSFGLMRSGTGFTVSFMRVYQSNLLPDPAQNGQMWYVIECKRSSRITLIKR